MAKFDAKAQTVAPPTVGEQIVIDIDRQVQANAKSGNRRHLGASGIGEDCHRRIWYDWRWFGRAKPFSGRLLRLFQRGHDEEPRAIGLLRSIGFVITERDPVTNEQFHISDHEGHFGGSGDGKIEDMGQRYNLPGVGLFENKTIGSKYMTALVKDGVKVAQPKHYKQFQTYMHKMGLAWALYMNTCKDNDELHIEVVENDGITGPQMVDKAGEIIWSNGPPMRIASTPADFRCKMCDYSMLCHYGTQQPAKNCRTCIQSRPDSEGTWYCDKHHATIPPAFMYKGCDEWTPHG